jgi:thiamine-monophosphate kinase
MGFISNAHNVVMTSLTEFDLIEQYFAQPARSLPAHARVRLGIGDDCALLNPRNGYELAVSSDMLIEGRHFLPSVEPMHLGHKALAVNLSDLAACGATPLGFTLAMALPQAQASWLAAFSKGMFALAQQHGIALIGGDTTKSVQPDRVSPGPICLCITVMGEVPQGQALLRSGAQVSDDIYVSGTLGDARLALGQFLDEWRLSEEGFAQLRQRMEQPTPRVALGIALRGIASSAVDVSDGFVGDLAHILTRSGVGAQIQADALPRSEWLAKQSLERQRHCTLNGGDDYELIFTAPAHKATAVQAAAKQAQTAVKKVGYITADKARVLLDDKQQHLNLSLKSFDHFA